MKKFCFILLCAATWSCSKKENVTGTILNAITGEPVQGVYVCVERFFPGGEEGSVNRIGESVSNARGQFGMDISSKSMRNKYKIVCPLYFPATEDSIQKAYLKAGPNEVELDNEKTQDLKFNVIPSVRFRLTVYAKNNYVEGDSLYVQTIDPHSNTIFFVFPGSSSSGTSRRYHVPTNNTGKIALQVYLKRAGKVTEYVDSVKAAPFSKVDYLLSW